MEKKWKRILGVLICAMLLCSGIPVNAKEQVKISDKEYLLNLSDAGPLFISNDIAVSGEVGSKVFLTYTVDKVMKDTIEQCGVIGTNDNTVTYPFDKSGNTEGTLSYEVKSILLDEGYTYVMKFERTEEGMIYDCAKLKGDKAFPIDFSRTIKYGEKDDYKYYGIWLSEGKASTLLNHVRCYDENGKDLGIHFNNGSGMIQNEMNVLLGHNMTIGSSYSFTLKDANTISISNKYPTESSVVYMEYEVADVEKDNTYQQGFIVTRAPKENYPFANSNGWMTFKMYNEEEMNGDKLLLTEGARYFICFVKKSESCDVVIQRTINGVTESISLPNLAGQYDPTCQYFSLWLGEGPDYDFSATFKNFKCYDAEGNSLGIQMKDKTVVIEESGEIDNYANCNAVYYCKENNTFIALKDDKTASLQVDDKAKEDATYRIMEKTNLYLDTKSGKKVFDYNEMVITDEDGNKYFKMKTSKVTFVTGEKTIVTKADAETGFRAIEQEAPTKEGNTFMGWCLRNGEAYDFNTVVTESITLYAKWKDGDGNEYLAIEQSGGGIKNVAMVIAIASSAVIMAASVAACIVIIKRRKRQ